MVRDLRRFSSLHKIYNYTFIYLSFELFRRLSIVLLFFSNGRSVSVGDNRHAGKGNNC